MDEIISRPPVSKDRYGDITRIEPPVETLPGLWEDRLLVGAIVLIAMALRPGIASIGPVLPLISAEFSLSHAVASLLTTIPTLLMGLLALPTPWLAHRFGRNTVLLLSLLLLFVSMVTRSFVTAESTLLLTTVGVGAGIAIAGTLFAGIIKARFPGKVALMMSIYATSLAFSSTLSAAATGPIAQFSGESGWRFGTGFWSLFALIAIFAGFAILTLDRRKPPVAAGQTTAARLPLTNRTAWLIALFFACDNFLFFAFLSWTLQIYIERGMSVTSARLMLTTFMVAFTVAMPVVGALSRAHDRRGWLGLCGALAAVGALGLAIAPLSTAYLWIAIAAAGTGGGFTLGMTLPLDNAHGAKDANAWNAFVMTVGYLVAAGGPFLVGSLRDMTGGFSIPIWLLFAIALAMLFLSPFLAPHISGADAGRSTN
jgi:CP family cyanate transporter-like MFS transporter